MDIRFPEDDDNYTCVVNNDLDEAVKRHARLQVIGKLNELFGFMSGGSKDRWLKAVLAEGQITELIVSLCYDSPLVAWSSLRKSSSLRQSFCCTQISSDLNLCHDGSGDVSRARNGLSGLSHRTVAQCVEVLTQWNLVAGARGPGIAQRCKHWLWFEFDFRN